MSRNIFYGGDEDAVANINGITNHVICVLDSDLSSATIEDKQNCLEMSQQEVCQVVTQTTFQVDRLINSIDYAPVEYVGLLQNGPQWIAVLRKIVYGKVCWTCVRTTPAFEFNESLDSERTATEIRRANCVEIAHLIEHAYCIADNIADIINDPSKNPKNAGLGAIEEYNHHSDDEVEDDQDAAKGNSEDFAAPGKVGGAAAAAPARQSARHQQRNKDKTADSSDRKNSLNGRDTAGSPSWSQRHEYFVLPLSIANVARHTVS